MSCSNFLVKETELYTGNVYYYNIHNNFNRKLLDSKLKNGYIQVLPCGRCHICRIRKVNEWVKRMEWESEQWKYKYFITLTYSEKNRPYELVSKDLTNFIKRLRRYIEYRNPNSTIKKIKYFASGEYGDKSGREHFHMIIFSNWEIPDLIPIKKFNNGIYNKSQIVSKIWKNGFVVICPALSESFAYVAYYSIKSLSKPKINDNLQYFKLFLKHYNLIYSIYTLKNDISIKSQNEIYNTFKNAIDFQGMKKPQYIVMSKKTPIGYEKLMDLIVSHYQNKINIFDYEIPKSLIDLIPDEKLQSQIKSKNLENFNNYLIQNDVLSKWESSLLKSIKQSKKNIDKII